MNAAPNLYAYAPTPLGDVLLVGDDHALTGVYYSELDKCPRPTADAWCRADSHFDDIRQHLDEYFAGTRDRFDLPLAPRGSTFQQQVWAALRKIPYGTTATYGQIAAEIGKPAAVRAVGAANARNPIAIIIPCHRVIGADGRLTGFAGGLERKAWLLDHERGVV
jgi:methylated-DNA-[protein]-cysteine S-methyltransferase